MLSRFLSKLSRLKGGEFPFKLTDFSGSKSSSFSCDADSPIDIAVPAWEPGMTILDRYRIEQKMSGSMGNVYIAEHLGWKVKMAIKSPRPEVLADKEGLQRILKEANSWVRMGMHPNVTSCYYVLTIDKIPHLFIEFVDGGDLSAWIKTGRCRNLRTSLSLAIQFCHGMEYTHSQGIIHRDIKPQNVLITKNSLLKITDFGILLSTAEPRSGKIAPMQTEKVDQEATIGFRGTPGYASPEQLRNAHNVDERTDIFSFGLCLWLMLCGKKPFLNNAVKSKIPVPTPVTPGVVFPAILKEILVKSVAYEPAERYKNFTELREALNESYLAAFNAACPYAELANIDLRADSLNNRAVSLFELGQNQEAQECLSKTLEINDMLPEAIYNNILSQWRSGKIKPARILRQIETTKKRIPQPLLLDELESAVKTQLLGDKIGADGRPPRFPEFRLCIPKSSLEIFREGQLNLSVQRNILDHLENKQYSACHDILMTAWRNNSFKKDRVYNQVYDQLLRHGRKDEIVGVQRFITLKGRGIPATHLCYIPASRKIASAGTDGKVVIRDLSAGQQEKTLDTDGIAITAMATCPAGKYLAIGTEDGGVTLISTKTGKRDSKEILHKGPTFALGFNADGRYLASGGADGVLKLKKITAAPEKSISLQEGGAIRSICFSARNLNFITGSEDGTIRFWESGGNECSRIIEAHALPVLCISASPDGLRFASSSDDRQIKIWDSQTSRCLRTIAAHEEAITAVLYLPDNRTVVSSCEDDIIKLWKVETGECLTTLDGRGDGIYSLAQGPKPYTFLAGRKDGAVVLWMIIYSLKFS